MDKAGLRSWSGRSMPDPEPGARVRARAWRPGYGGSWRQKSRPRPVGRGSSRGRTAAVGDGWAKAKLMGLRVGDLSGRSAAVIAAIAATAIDIAIATTVAVAGLTK